MTDNITASNSHRGSVSLNVKDGGDPESNLPRSGPVQKNDADTVFCLPFMQKLLAELVGTYYLIFAGCAAIAVNAQHKDVVTLVGIALVWGMVVMVLVYSLEHISAHFNPAVTIAFVFCNRFPVKHVPIYIAVQVLGSTLASATLRVMFDLNTDVCSKKHDVFLGSSPSGASLQAFVMEFVITGFLMFVVCATATDTRAVKPLAGLAIGAAVLLNVLFAAEVSGASMNPARTLGPALVWSCYKNIWIYLFAPTIGAVSGACIYNLLRHTDITFGEMAKSSYFLNKGHQTSA